MKYKPCCKWMGRAIDYENIIIDRGSPCINDKHYNHIPLFQCPWCDEPIKFKDPTVQKKVDKLKEELKNEKNT